MSQELSVYGFKWREDTLWLDKGFSDAGYRRVIQDTFLKLV